MSAAIGPGDRSIHDSPRPLVLRAISGLEPVTRGTHVMLDEIGVRSAQRLAAGDIGGALWLALWPAELKAQAEYLYGGRLSRPMISTARDLGWDAVPGPHLAFWNAAAALRLYLTIDTDVLEYARRWEDGGLHWVGAHSASELQRIVWPWLKDQGYVTDRDDRVLEAWLRDCLKRRPALLRPGLRLMRQCRASESPEVLRREVNAILTAAHEPLLPLP